MVPRGGVHQVNVFKGLAEGGTLKTFHKVLLFSFWVSHFNGVSETCSMIIGGPMTRLDHLVPKALCVADMSRLLNKTR